jgi:hypothetical protein
MIGGKTSGKQIDLRMEPIKNFSHVARRVSRECIKSGNEVGIRRYGMMEKPFILVRSYVPLLPTLHT